MTMTLRCAMLAALLMMCGWGRDFELISGGARLRLPQHADRTGYTLVFEHGGKSMRSYAARGDGVLVVELRRAS